MGAQPSAVLVIGHWLTPKLQHAAVPDRWIIFRFVSDATAVQGSPLPAVPPALTAFIVESNRIRHLGGSEMLDVETEAAPFIDRTLPVEKQADVFLGMKRRFDDTWEEELPGPDAKYHSPLSLLDSANPFFADFQHHNSNVFSIHDDLTWTAADGTSIVSPATATVSYAVFGYFSNLNGASKTVCYGSLFDVKWNRYGPPLKIAAEDVAARLQVDQPVSLGRDTLEALESYLHCMPGTFEWAELVGEMKAVIGQAGRGGLLDGHVPENLRAGFKPIDGGRCWRFKTEDPKGALGGHPHIPTDDEMKAMHTLDAFQAYSDALKRQERYLRHSLFCEWWKRRAQIPGGRWQEAACRRESAARIREGLRKLDQVKKLRLLYNKKKLHRFPGLHPTARPEFFSRAAPAIVIGGLGASWPLEFLEEREIKGRDLKSLPFRGTDGRGVVQDWLNSLIKKEEPGSSTQSTVDICTMHGMKLFFESQESVAKIKDEFKTSNNLMRLPDLFKQLDGLEALHWFAPGWVREAVDTLMQEWVYIMNGQPLDKLPALPTYHSKENTHWNDTQPYRALFVEWELEYYHLPKRFWSLEKNPDGTADYKVAPGVNISAYDGMELHRRTMSGRSLLRPNAAWPLTTLMRQLVAKLDKGSVAERDGLRGRDLEKQLREALQPLDLVVGSLDGLTDHLLTLQQGIHIVPHPSSQFPPSGPEEEALLAALLESGDGFDVTPYGETVYSHQRAERDFKPVTHGQARFTKFNVVDRFGQVISPMSSPGPLPLPEALPKVAGEDEEEDEGEEAGGGKKPRKNSSDLYPCVGRSIACSPNDAEGGSFANGVWLDEGGRSQFFQLGHRINQDARVNAYFAVNSAEWEAYNETTQWFRGDQNDSSYSSSSSSSSFSPSDSNKSSPHHAWRPATEYEDPVWGWLVLDFRSRGIQIYNADGESMGEVLLPTSIHGKVTWQVYYAEGDLSEGGRATDNSQLQEMMQRMSDAKYLFGLWSMLADACQNIHHDPTGAGVDAHLLNLVGRPMALVNIGLSLELATPVMQTQSYADLNKAIEIALDEYKFEVLLGDRNNLHDGLVGYFVPPPPPDCPCPCPCPYHPLPQEPSPEAGQTDFEPTTPSEDPVAGKRPDPSCIYTEFGYPGRNVVDTATAKPDTFASPSSSKVYLSPIHVDPSDAAHAHDPASYTRALHNHRDTCILGAIIDPFQPVHLATGILPSSTLSLPSWVVGRTLKGLRLLFRGGPLLTRSDLEGADEPSGGGEAYARPPANQTRHEAHIPPITDGGSWGWLQPVLGDGATDDVPTFLPYDLKEVAAEYPLEAGPHTILEGFYKFDMPDLGEGGKYSTGTRPVPQPAGGGPLDKLRAETAAAREEHNQAAGGAGAAG